MNSTESHRAELRAAVRHLGDRCLYSAAKWAAELLNSLDPPPSSSSAVGVFPSSASSSVRATPSSSTLSGRRHIATASASSLRRRIHSADVISTPVAGVSYVTTPVPHDDELDGAGDRYLLAKSFLDCKEFRRAAHALKGQTAKKAIFLRSYALYLVSALQNYFAYFELVYT